MVFEFIIGWDRMGLTGADFYSLGPIILISQRGFFLDYLHPHLRRVPTYSLNRI